MALDNIDVTESRLVIFEVVLDVDVTSAVLGAGVGTVVPCIGVFEAELVCVLAIFRDEDVALMAVVITEESLHVVGKLTLFS